MDAHTTTTGRIIRLPEVKSLTGLGRSSIYAYMKNGEFPASILITQRSIGWVEHEVLSWVKNRIDQSRAVSA
jgi:prophage regulatory protein